jgi:hypothetical protein
MDALDDLKSWWILPRSMRLNPPSLPGEEDDGIGQAKGSICPGHFIPAKSKHWTKILNRTGPLPYPPEMPVSHGEQWDMSWQVGNERNVGLLVKIGAPVAGMVGATVNADAEAAFKNSVANYWNFDKLDTYMVQPWDSYIADSLKDAGVATHIKNTSLFGTWEVHMISGIVVARGATMNREVTHAKQLGAGGGAGALGLAEGSAHVRLLMEQQVSTSIGKMSDFVWAIQIARVHKAVGHRNWEWETLWDEKGTGSTFAVGGQADARQRFEKTRGATTDDGLANASVFGLETGRNIFVVPVEGADPAGSHGSDAEPENNDGSRRGRDMGTIRVRSGDGGT